MMLDELAHGAIIRWLPENEALAVVRGGKYLPWLRL